MLENITNISTYDFKKSQRFSKEQLKALSIFGDNFTTNASLYLNDVLSTKFKIESKELKQISYIDYTSTLDNSKILTEFEMISTKNSKYNIQNLLFITDRQFILELLDIMMGGKGVVKNSNRKFTDIDHKLISHLFGGLLSKIYNPDNIYKIQITNIHTNNSTFQAVFPNDIVATLNFNVIKELNVNKFEFCIPFKKMESVLDKLSPKAVMQKNEIKEDNSEFKKELVDKVKDITLQLTVEVGGKTLTLEELMNLGPTDILKLNKKIKDPLDVYVGDIKTFEGIPGLIEDKKGISIIDNIRKELNDND